MTQGRDVPLESTIHLIARARGGDNAALEQLFARHEAQLRRWARGRLPHWARQLADTDDLVQDALLQTFKRIEGFEPRGPGALQAYLRQVLFNRLRDELRKRGRQPPGTDLDDPAAANAIESGDSPLEQAIGRENLERYEAALSRLKQEEREAIVGRIEMGYTYQELAEAVGKPSADAARKATQRALIRLAEEMHRGRE
ncbi:MAG: sigma-70 family RNA polymerase sigma factor [Acidobacteria bacterium]|nr:sigma-70 family RNA polymerase sigma factor [Acidobacteriota bacterium]